jgi:hypothetical protein
VAAGSEPIRVRGARQLRATLKAAGRDVAEMTETNAEVSRLVATEAASRAPRRTGRLAGSTRPNRSKTKAIVRAGGAAVPYANAIHWGTGPRTGRRGPHNIARRPWIWNAAAATQTKVLQLYWTRVQQSIRHVKGA